MTDRVTNFVEEEDFDKAMGMKVKRKRYGDSKYYTPFLKDFKDKG